MTNSPFHILPGTGNAAPIIISIPHCGIDFPDELKDKFLPEQVQYLDDTDWYLQLLNDFAPELGITVIYARYSRWVIDLNRDPHSVPLYNDGRLITGLTTTTDFLGNPLYHSGHEPDQAETERRLAQYYWPYYHEIQSLLDERKAKFGKALLWDAHSIRRVVKSIRQDPFPEMILGDNDEKSAGKKFIDITLKNLSSTYQVNHNTPFKGGHITRYFGKPQNEIHALQLERCKNLYMDDQERNYDPSRANTMREILKKNFSDLIEVLVK